MESWESLNEYVKAKDAEASLVEACWLTAVVIVDDFVGSAVVPASLLQFAYLRAGAALYQSRTTQNGIAGYAPDNSTPVFAPKDVLNTVYPLLSRYVGKFA